MLNKPLIKLSFIQRRSLLRMLCFIIITLLLLDINLNNEQLNKLMIEADKLKEIINSPHKPKEKRFFELIQDLTPKWDKVYYPNSTFYFKGDKFWLEYNEKDSCVWVRYDGFWDVFEEDYSLNYQDTNDFLKDMLEEHFKWKEVTPVSLNNIFRDMLEEHFR